MRITVLMFRIIKLKRATFGTEENRILNFTQNFWQIIWVKKKMNCLMGKIWILLICLHYYLILHLTFLKIFFPTKLVSFIALYLICMVAISFSYILSLCVTDYKINGKASSYGREKFSHQCFCVLWADFIFL